MAKLILFSHYLKDSVHAANLIKYIATREGVEYNISGLKGKVTDKQVKLITELTNEYSFLKQIDEYKNYVKENTKSNASEFLTEAFSLIDDQLVSKEIYLKYIAERPGVEKIKTHGLFNSNGAADLDKELENIKNHKGIVWTQIISLKREDAARLGYDNLKQWQHLLKAKMPAMARTMHIDTKNLVWDAAFHNEGHHPHVHLVMYSKDPNEGFLKEKGIEKIKSILMNEIYKDELLSIKQDKTLKRDEIKSEFGKDIDKAYENIVSKNLKVNDKVINEILELSKMLPRNGKLVYGYQSKDVKDQVNKVVDAVLENQDIKKLYDEYVGYKKNLAEYYSGKELSSKKITDDKEFRKLQNMVLKAADKVLKNEMPQEQKASIDKNENAGNLTAAINQNGNADIDNTIQATDTDKIMDKLEKLNSEVKAIENKFKKEHEIKNEAFADTKAVKLDNILGEEREAIELKNSSIKNMGDKFLSISSEYSTDNATFIKVIDKIYGVKNPCINKFDEEDALTQEYIKEAAKTIFSDSRINEDSSNYLKACKEYDIAFGKTTLHDELKDFYDEIVSRVSLDKLSDIKTKLDEILGKYNKTADPEDKIKDKVMSGAKKLKDEFNLNSKLDVNYKDYTKPNKDEIKYIVKGMIFDLVDEMYFSAKEEEYQKNRLNMKNKGFFRNRNKAKNTLRY